MGVFDNYPYTNFHELNLDWVIEDMRKLDDAYDGLKKEIQETIDYINNFEEHADELIKQQIDIALSYYNQRLNQLAEELKALQELLNNKVFKDIDDINAEIKAIKNNISNIEFNVNQKILQLEELMHEYKHSIDDIVDGKTQELENFIIDKVTKLDRLDVINPLTGAFEDIQNVLNEMAAIITKSYGITASQYDSLNILAWKYDSYLLTAEEYSTRGYFRLYLTLTLMLMRSPFTGQITTIEDVVTKLSELHKCALTAIEYDNGNFTAEEYDKMQITAFGYDWWGFKIVGFITAQSYDSLQLTAFIYDGKKITAEMYDRGLKALIDASNNSCQNQCCGDYALLANQITVMQAQISELQKQILAANIGYVIAEMYDSLTLEALDYDYKNITAEMYNQGMKYLV